MSRGRRFHVLIATDGSVAAKAAVTTALGFPWPRDARASAVVATHVRAEYRKSILLSALDRTAQSVAQATSRALARRWADAESRVVDVYPVSGVVQEARRTRADIIVVGWRGHGPVRRLLAGSVSRGIVRQAPCAVLVVRRAVRETRRIVVGLDGSPHARRAVSFVAGLDAPDGGTVTLVTAVDRMQAPSGTFDPAGARSAVAAEVHRINRRRESRARADLVRAARTLSAAGWKVDQVVVPGAPLYALLAVVKRTRANLLVVGARGASGLRHVLLGSVAEGALDRCPVPVVIAR